MLAVREGKLSRACAGRASGRAPVCLVRRDPAAATPFTPASSPRAGLPAADSARLALTARCRSPPRPNSRRPGAPTRPTAQSSPIRRPLLPAAPDLRHLRPAAALARHAARAGTGCSTAGTTISASPASAPAIGCSSPSRSGRSSASGRPSRRRRGSAASVPARRRHEQHGPAALSARQRGHRRALHADLRPAPGRSGREEGIDLAGVAGARRDRGRRAGRQHPGDAAAASRRPGAPASSTTAA